MRRFKQGGMLIVFSLLFTTVILMLVGSVTLLTRHGRFVSQTHASRIAALYAAEAGLADAIEQLNEDNSWAPTTSYVVDLPNGSASYSIQFAPNPPPTPAVDLSLSINNLHNNSAVDGPLGTRTVAPHSVYLVVNGNAGASSRRLDAVLNTTPFQHQRGPFVTSGRIALKGNVSVVGRKSFTDWTPVKAGIHSNLSGAIADTITWERVDDADAFVDGIVSASSVSSSAINTTLGTGTGNFNADALLDSEPSRRFPRLRVGRAVDRAFDSGTVSTFTPSGVSPQILVGENKIGAPGASTVINGDLVLNNANLYVDGNFRVNGSITGNGSVFVKGDTRFSGASEVTVNSVDHTAIYSAGHVTLEGFDGSDFLEVLVTDPDRTIALEQGLSALQTQLASTDPFGTETEQLRNFLAGDLTSPPAPLDPLNPTPEELADIAAFNADITFLQSALGDTSAGVPFTEAEILDISGIVGEVRGEIQIALGASPDPDEARTLNFLAAKFGRLDDILGNPDPGDPVTIPVWNQYRNLGEVNKRGLLRYLINNPTAPDSELLANEVQSLHFDALGTSYFKGIIFAGGAIHSTNDVEVFGGIFAHRSSESPTYPLTVDGDDYLSGDVVLNNGCRVTYVEQLVDNPASRLNRNIVVPVSWFTPNLR